jgi:hypothetical protein
MTPEFIAQLDEAQAAEVRRAPKREPLADGYGISGREAADLFVQGAWRRSRDNGEKMKEMVTALRRYFFTTGGAFGVTGDECHPNVPGVNWYMAQWQDDFLRALEEHIAQIRV